MNPIHLHCEAGTPFDAMTEPVRERAAQAALTLAGPHVRCAVTDISLGTLGGVYVACVGSATLRDGIVVVASWIDAAGAVVWRMPSGAEERRMADDELAAMTCGPAH